MRLAIPDAKCLCTSIYLADDTKGKSSKLLLHGNLSPAISERPEPLQKLVHTLIEGGDQTFEIASVMYNIMT